MTWIGMKLVAAGGTGMGRMHAVRTRAAAIALLTTAAFIVRPLVPVQGSPTTERKTSVVAPGVTFTKMKVAGPNQIRMVTVNLAQAGAIDVVSAGKTIPAFAKTSTMASSDSGHAIAAINGDFGLYPGRPAHAFAYDGQLGQTSVLGQDGKNFAVRADETSSFLGSPASSITVQDTTHPKTFTADHWNEGAPKSSEVSVWSDFGGSLDPPAKNLCSARLLPSGVQTWATGKLGISRTFTVDAEVCGASAMALSGGIVVGALSSGTRKGDITALVKGDSVTVTWSLGWPGVTEAIGGSPVLIDNGKVVVTNCSTYLCEKQPRSIVGIKANGDIMLVTIDGRWPGYSIGMTELEEANFMLGQGAVYALNLDGGGSSTMWVKGQIKNSPSDGTERAVSSAILVLSGADSDGSPLKAPSVPPPAAVSAAAAQSAWHAALTDPGSTGGLLDSLDAGGRALSESEQNWLHTFRAAQP
jgi:hypothetical protein